MKWYEGWLSDTSELAFHINNILLHIRWSDYDERYTDLKAMVTRIIVQTWTCTAIQEITVNAFGKPLLIRDYPSFIVIMRSIVETYAKWYCIFFSAKDDDEREFVDCAYRLSGLIWRKKQKLSNGSKNSFYEKDSREIEYLTKRIEATQKYSQLPNKRQSSLIEQGVFLTTDEQSKIVHQSGIADDIYRNFYAIGSEYTHSGYFATKQLRAEDDWIDEALKYPALMLQAVVGYIFEHLAKKFDEAKAYAESEPQVRMCWNRIKARLDAPPQSE